MKSKWIRLRNIVLIMGMFLGVLVVGTTVAQADVSEVNPLSESVTTVGDAASNEVSPTGVGLRSAPMLTHCSVTIARNKINGTLSKYCTVGSSVTSNLPIPKQVLIHVTIDGKAALTILYKGVGLFAHKEQKLPKAVKFTGERHLVSGYMAVTAPGYNPTMAPLATVSFE